MSFEPQKLFIGLMDFFSILLPGAFVTYLLKDSVGPQLLGARYASIAGSEGWAAFLFASYLCGHLIFLLSSWLDEFYDAARRRTLNAQIAGVARDGKVPAWPLRAFVWLVFKREQNRALDRVIKIKRQMLGRIRAEDAVNAFQWSKILLNIRSQPSLTVVQRFEADSKFFRCFAVVLLLLLIASPWQRSWPIPVVLVLFLLAFWRYMEQRYKATNQAYWSVITLAAENPELHFDAPVMPAGAPSHAGGVVFRRRGERVEYLLVEASDSTEWVLPKGHVEEGEHDRETAVREVLEESGVWGRVIDALATVAYEVDGKPVRVAYFLMEYAGRGWRLDKNRGSAWLTIEEARRRASHKETRELLERAERQRTQGVSSDAYSAAPKAVMTKSSL